MVKLFTWDERLEPDVAGRWRGAPMAVTGGLGGGLAALLVWYDALVVVTVSVAVFMHAVSRRLVTARLR